MAGSRPSGRQRGRIEKRGDTLRAVVYAGIDPVTGWRTYKRETIDGTDEAAYKRAEKAITKLLAEVDKQRAPSSVANFNHAIDQWLKTAEIAVSTRDGYIERVIRPHSASSR